MAIISASAMGTKLIKKKKAPETTDWEVGSLTSIGGVSVDTEERNVTTLDSPGGAEEFEQGKKTPGDVPFRIKVKKDADEIAITKILALLASGSKESWEVQYPSGSKWNFDGYIKAYEAGEATPEGDVEFGATIKVSGLPTFTPAT